MAVPRRLWTGPPGAAFRDRILMELPSDATTLWIVPTPLARDRLVQTLLARHPGRMARASVLCWDDLWRRARQEADDGPRWLSEASTRAVFHEAIRRADEAGELKAIEESLPWPGYRRRLQTHFRTWTLAERAAGPPRIANDDPAQLAEQVLFTRYRALLEDLRAEDNAGMALWASRTLKRRRASGWLLSGVQEIVFLDLDEVDSVRWRVLQAVLDADKTVHVSLPHESEPTASEIYLAVSPVRDRLLKVGFEETHLEDHEGRPAGLRGSSIPSSAKTSEPVRVSPPRTASRFAGHLRVRASAGCSPARSSAFSTKACLPKRS